MSDGGDGISLREAITAANITDGSDTVTFNIGGGGLQTIVVGATALPTIADTLVLDATTQGGYAGNPLIQLDGTATTGSANGLTISTTTNDSTIKGFVVHSFADEGIEVLGDNNTIQNNWVGIDSNGDAAGNTEHGIILAFAASGNLIGGSGADEGNVVAGNGFSGIFLRDAGTDNNLVYGNLIGVRPDGVAPQANGQNGIVLSTAVANNSIGGTGAGEGNIIAHNTLAGISVNNDAGTGNAILGNSIHDNLGLGIDLVGGTEDAFGVTANDVGDADVGANNLQNAPVLTSAITDESTTVTISGSINSTVSTNLRIEFYANSANDSSGYGESDRYLGSTTVTTDGSGNATFSTPLATTVAHNEWISATATVDLGGGNYGDTSEFAQSIEAIAIPIITSNGGGATAGVSLDENLTAVTTVTTTDSDVPADTINYTITGGADAAKFSLNLTSGALSFLAAPDFENPTDAGLNNVYEVEVTANDGNGGTDVQLISVTITPVNDNTPVAVAETATVAEGGTVTILDGGATSVLDNDTDADAPGDTLTAVLDSGPANGASFTLNADGTFSYQHDGTENLSDSFSYHVFDGVNNGNTVVVNITDHAGERQHTNSP